MSTRMFKVEYFITDHMAGSEMDTIKEDRTVVAKDAEHAIIKTKSIAVKPYSFTTDDGSKKKIRVTRKHFDPIKVTLEAESD